MDRFGAVEMVAVATRLADCGVDRGGWIVAKARPVVRAGEEIFVDG
jgi:hypothetical protein